MRVMTAKSPLSSLKYKKAVGGGRRQRLTRPSGAQAHASQGDYPFGGGRGSHLPRPAPDTRHGPPDMPQLANRQVVTTSEPCRVAHPTAPDTSARIAPAGPVVSGCVG